MQSTAKVDLSKFLLFVILLSQYAWHGSYLVYEKLTWDMRPRKMKDEDWVLLNTSNDIHVDAGEVSVVNGERHLFSHIFYKSFIYVNWIHQTINYTERMDQHVFEKLYAYREALKQINWQIVSPKMASANGAFFKASLFYAKQQSKEQLKVNVTLHIVIYKRSSLYKI